MTKKFDSLKNEMQLMIDSEPKLKAYVFMIKILRYGVFYFKNK